MSFAGCLFLKQTTNVNSAGDMYPGLMRTDGIPRLVLIKQTDKMTNRLEKSCLVFVVFLILFFYLPHTVESRYLEVDGTIFTCSNYPKCKLICTSGNLDL